VSDAFWAWVIATVGIGGISAVSRDRHTAPWAAGCAAAAALEALRVAPGWQWGAMLALSSIVSVAVNRVPRYRGRHSKTER
jgi:hypothetical protein